MNRTVRISISLVCLLAWMYANPPLAAAQDEQTIKLDRLEKNAGANFGDWIVWRSDEADTAIFLIHQKTGLAVYLPWSSNGWINFRTKAGDWHVLYSKGDAEKQERSKLKIASFLDKKAPLTLGRGECKFNDWTVKITRDAIDFRNTVYDDHMVIRADSGTFIHNGRTIGVK